MRFLVVVFSGLVGAGCGEDPPVRTDLPYELYCDIASSDCQQRIYDSLAVMLDAEGFEMPGIRTISVEQHEREVRSGVDLENLTGEDAESRGLRLMGFIPETSESVVAARIEYWINRVSAYYWRGSHVITIIDRDYDEIDAQVLLAHELIHAIQNSQFVLNEVSADADTDDGLIAVRSVIEGDAEHNAFAWAYELLGYEPDSIDWDALHDDSQATLREHAADPERALIDSAASFPYAYGFDYMTEVITTTGLPGRAAAFEAPPRTVFEVVTGPRSLPPSFDFPQVAHPSPLEGHSVEIESRFGAWYLYGVLRQLGLSHDAAWATMLGWRGDELAVYQSGDDVVAVWRVRFEDGSDGVTLEAEINGGEAAEARAAVLFGDEVFVFAAESQDSLLAWVEQPLDSMTASIVPKAARHRGGAVTPGNCMKVSGTSLTTRTRLRYTSTYSAFVERTPASPMPWGQ
jgi:hypothetical protein